MHETAIAYEIMRQVTTECRKADGKKVTGIEIEVGEFSGVDSSMLRTAMEAAYRKTIDIEIITISAQALCHDCHTRFKPSVRFEPCPVCRNYRYDLICGEELRLRAIWIE